MTEHTRPVSTPPTKAQLVNESYANDEPLLARIETHRRYSVPPIDLPTWVLNQRAWRGDETVLDIGTGTGQYLAPLRARAPRGCIIGADLAPGMLRDMRAKGIPGGARLLNADAEALPLAAALCDVVIASYVLFFVPDIPRVLAEARRVLRPGGVLLAVTMVDLYMEELRVAISAALRVLGATRETRAGMIQRRFSLDNGPAQLAPYFASVTAHKLEAALVFPSAGPVLAYVNSMQDVVRADLPPGKTWGDFLTALRAVVEAELAAQGEFRVTKEVGVLIAV